MLIYKITNLVHGRVYIGQTIQSNPKMRWYSHWDYVRKGRKSYLYDSMRKHGMENFNWEIIDRADTVEQLNELEVKWLNYYRSIGEVVFLLCVIRHVVDRISTKCIDMST